jgi:hypothetical protein
MIMPINVQSRIWKTKLLVENRALFLDCVRWDIGKVVRRARQLGMKPAIRVNGTSNLPWLSLQMPREFPEVQFYDYTKWPKPYLRMSLIHTCELNGANPFDYLTELLRHAAELKQHPSEWMPWKYRDTLVRLARPAAA